MGGAPRQFSPTTSVLGTLLLIILLFEVSRAMRPTGIVRSALRRKQGEESRQTKKTTDEEDKPSRAGSKMFNDMEPMKSIYTSQNQRPWYTSPATANESIVASKMTSMKPSELTVTPHSNAILPCEIDLTFTDFLLPTASYRLRPAKWLHEGNPVDMITIDTRTEMSGTGHRYIGDSTTASLHIENVRIEDDGVWTCTFEDQNNKILFGRPIKLTVLDPPRGTYLLIDNRRLDPGNQFVPVKEGLELILECAAEGGNPPAALTWSMTLSQSTLDGPELLPDNLTIVPSIVGGHSGARLKVVRGHHNATITCIAEHKALLTPMNASILLDVQYTPSFAITRLPGFGIPIIEGMAVSLKCEVDSNPTSAPIWQRDNGVPPVEQSDDGWLNFTKISRADSGWYKCYTRHMTGIFTSIGYFLNVRYLATEAEAPSGDVAESRKMEVQIGGAVTLECDGGCWGHGPAMDPVGGPGALKLNRVVYQDAGEYRCVKPGKKNEDSWRAQLPYYIRVVGRPVIHPSKQILTQNEGDAFDVNVEFCAEPTYNKVLWIFEDHLVLQPGLASNNEIEALSIEDGETESCYRTVLRFNKLQWIHSGEWIFIVRSPNGMADASIFINVTRATSNADYRTVDLVVIFCLSLILLRCHR